MGAERTELLLVSDFNVSDLANVLRARDGFPWEARHAPLDQVMQTLATASDPHGYLLVWTRPEAVSSGFRDVLAYRPADLHHILAEVDVFADALLHVAGRHRSVFVPTWQVPAFHRYGTAELAARAGVFDLVARMDLHLSDRLAARSDIHRLHTARWLQQVGEAAWSDRLWYLTKTPFHRAVFKAAADDLAAIAEQGRTGAIKLIVLDLDDTLWGGVVGDDGWENLQLGGHDPAGESFVAFQHTLKGLKERGILLAIASKNDEAVALEAISKHPEMVLREEDFVAMRIDWNDKGENIAAMVRGLNIGEAAVMFVDDNPVERARVKAVLPDVFVPEWPANKLLYDRTLRSLPVFDLAGISAEDRQRTRLYQQEADRERSRTGPVDVEDWLRSLEMVVHAEPLNEATLPRVHQLFNKTNQFNLTTRRWTEKELRSRMKDPQRPVWSFRVSDRFGDAGLTGILGMDLTSPDKAVVNDLVLSCRVMGRRVEETLLHVAWNMARKDGKAIIEARHIPTPKNNPCLQFMLRSGWMRDGDRFSRYVADPVQRPATIELVWA